MTGVQTCALPISEASWSKSIYIKISVNYLTQEGSNIPDISMLVEIAEFYEVDIREIIDGERKSENMNDEVKVTILAVADYADKQKNKRY